jgi:predicted lysophospholipase L1 biosynthesis ABC-type transport system permease subunit
MARRLWPGEEAVGKRFRTGDADWTMVVGVLRDTRQWGWSDPVQNEMYLPFWQDAGYLHGRAQFRSLMLVVRTSASPSTLGAAMRTQLRAIDPDVPLTAMQSLEQVMGDAVWQQRMEMTVLSGFAALALVLAVVGIYAVMSYVVGGRTQEIGIRMALGAAKGHVLGMVLAQSLRPVVAGLAIGLAGAAGLTQWMRTMLYGVKPADPLVLTAAAGLLGLVAVGAALIPANRAAGVDPLTALRQD